MDGADALAAGRLAVAPVRLLPAGDVAGRGQGVGRCRPAVRPALGDGTGASAISRDLARVAEICGAQGARVIGVNPLHALYPHRPAHASPYSPSSRRFVNVLYVDVEAVAEFTDCARARAHVHAPAFQAELAALRAAPLVDYVGVGALKLTVLRLLYAHARDRICRAPARARWTAFESFKSREGEALAPPCACSRRCRRTSSSAIPPYGDGLRGRRPIAIRSCPPSRNSRRRMPRDIEFYA